MTWGIQGCGRWGNRGTFCVVVNPLVRLVALLVSSQLSNLVLELLDNLKEDFYNSWVLWETVGVVCLMGRGTSDSHHGKVVGLARKALVRLWGR